MHRYTKLGLFLACLSVGSLYAQENPSEAHHPHHRGKHGHHKHMLKALNLTDAQKQALRAARKAEKEAHPKHKPGEIPNLIERFERREAQQKMLETVLTKEQQQQLETLKAEHASRRKAHKANKQKHKAAKEGRKAHYTNVVKPVLLPLRLEFEQQLSEDEKAQIAVLRTRIPAYKKEMRQARHALHSPTITRAEVEKLQQKLDVYREDVAQLHQLLNKYEDQIENLLHRIPKETRMQWRAHKKDAHKKGQHHHKHKKHHAHKHPKRGHKHAARFLLLDVQDAKVKDFDFSLFPNPSTGTTQHLKFELKEAAAVRIDLIDAAGQIVRPVLDKTLEAGAQQLQVDVSALKGRYYIYRVQIGAHTQSFPFQHVP